MNVSKELFFSHYKCEFSSSALQMRTSGCIDITNCNGPVVDNNHVYVSSDVSGIYDAGGNLIDFCNGIGIGGCFNAQITNNDVSSTAPWPYAWASWMQSGIRVAASPSSLVCHNTASLQGNHPFNTVNQSLSLEIGDPFEFLGNCYPTSFKDNYINQSTSRGLYMGGMLIDVQNGGNVNGTIIGTQGSDVVGYEITHNNYWNIAQGSLHTDFNNVDAGLNKFFMDYPTTILDGAAFDFQNNSQNNVTFANDPYYTFDSDPLLNVPTNTNCDPTSEVQKRLDAYDDIARDSIAKLGGTVNTRYLGKEFLYAEIKNDVSLAAIAALAQFKTQSDAASLRYIDEVKRGLTYPIDSTELLNLVAKTNLIAPSNINETLYKQVYELALANPGMRDSVYNDTQLDALREIANRCPFTDGNAVYMARVILHGFYTEESYYNYCEFAKNPKRTSHLRQAMQSQNIITDSVALDVKPNFDTYHIIPNPNNGSFTIQCPSNKNVAIVIFDSKGSVVFSSNIIPSNYLIALDLNNITSGIYNVVITNTYNERKSIKFSIIK